MPGATRGEAGPVIAPGDLALRCDLQRLADAGVNSGVDEAGGVPSRHLGQFDVETGGFPGACWSYRWFGDIAVTNYRFYQSTELVNCAYNHGVWRTGYCYRSRVVGHAGNNDARMISTGFLFVNDQDRQWSALVRYGVLNRGGAVDSRNSRTPTRQGVMSLDLTRSRVFTYRQFEFGLGVGKTDDEISGETSTAGRAFLQLRSSH